MQIFNLISENEGTSFSQVNYGEEIPNNENGDVGEYELIKEDFDRLFLERYGLQYISDFALLNKLDIRVIKFEKETTTCQEKAALLGSWKVSNTIKTIYFFNELDESIIAVVVPETGYKLDINNLKARLNIPDGLSLRTSKYLPRDMTYGTCSPFIKREDLVKFGGQVSKIIFDDESLIEKSSEKTFDDFSFGVDRKLSIQLNYHCCFEMLKANFGCVVDSLPLLVPSFTKKVGFKGSALKVVYEVTSLNYLAAKRITHEINDPEGSMENRTNLKIFNFIL